MVVTAATVGTRHLTPRCTRRPPGADAERVDILWSDAGARRSPTFVRIYGEASRWQTALGLTLGIRLRAVERLNRRPFRLAGFGFDGEGAVLSWSGGLLEKGDSKDCWVFVRIEAPWNTEGQSPGMYRQLLGDQEFSSGHPAMQALNPRIRELSLVYGPRPPRHPPSSETTTAEFERLYAAWHQEAEAIRLSSSTYDYIKLPSYRRIVALGTGSVPALEQKMTEDQGLDFMLAFAVVEICGWDREEFRGGGGEQGFRDRVLRKLRDKQGRATCGHTDGRSKRLGAPNGDHELEVLMREAYADN